MGWTPTFGIKLEDMTKELERELALAEKKYELKKVEKWEEEYLDFEYYVLNVFGTKIAVFGRDSPHCSRLLHDALKRSKVKHIILNGELDGCKFCVGEWKAKGES